MIKLLIADDEEEIRKGIRHQIDWLANGVEVCGEAEDGTQTLQSIVEQQPDIVLIDIRMPEMSGLEVAEAIRQRRYNVKSIILSGYDDFSFAQQAMKLGVSEYLLKPCLPSDILSTVLKVTSEIRRDRAEKERQQKLQAKLDESLQLLRQKGFAERLRGEADPASDMLQRKKNGNKSIDQAIRFIRDNYDKELNLELISSRLFMNANYFCLLFKQHVGVNFIDYVHQVRIEKACEILRAYPYKTYEVAAKVGYTNEKYFCRIFKRLTGMTPTQYRDTVS